MKSIQGFTLIELMVVVAIVAVLAAIALPSYTESVKKSHRAEGKAMLLEVAQLQERYYTENGHYGTLADLSLTGTALNSENGYYILSMPGFVSNALSFTLEVTPQGGHSDPECAILTLASTGEKGTRTGTSNRDYCW